MEKNHKGSVCMNESRETQSLQTGILPGKAGFKKVYPRFVLLCLTFLTGL